MQKNYAKAMAGVAVSEGGWSNDAADPGGPTMYGIIQVEYDAWRDRQKLPRQSVRKISDEDVAAIYLKQYAAPLHFNDLPSGVDYTVLDYGINSGVSRGSKELQRVVGTTPDGIIGLLTLAATVKADPIVVINAINDRRMAFLRGLKIFSVFGKGWTARVARVRADSLAMARPI